MKIKHYPIFAAIALLPTSVFFLSNSNGPQAAVAGSPLEGGNNCTQCHGGTANSGSGSLEVSGISEYTPGETYTITVNINDETSSKFGFQAIALDESNNPVGTLTSGTGTKIYKGSSADYIEHSSSSAQGAFTFDWTAPAEDMGDITFYAAGNASNSNGAVSGDNVYTGTTTASATSTSILNAELLNSIDIYSYSEGMVKVSVKDKGLNNLAIYNLNGQLVENTNNPLSEMMFNLEAGVYILKVSSEGKQATKKFQVQ